MSLVEETRYIKSRRSSLGRSTQVDNITARSSRQASPPISLTLTSFTPTYSLKATMRLSFLYIAALAALAIGKANATSSLRDMKRASIDMHRKAVVWSGKHVATPIRRQSRQLSRAFNAAASTAKTDFVRAANNGDVATTISLEVVRSLAREVKGVVMILKYIKEVVAQIPASSKHASVSLLKILKAHANMKALGKKCDSQDEEHGKEKEEQSGAKADDAQPRPEHSKTSEAPTEASAEAPQTSLGTSSDRYTTSSSCAVETSSRLEELAAPLKKADDALRKRRRLVLRHKLDPLKEKSDGVKGNATL